MNSNDFLCSSNIESLFAECERLSEIAKRKTSIIAQRKQEFDKFQSEKRLFEQKASLFNDQQVVQEKDTEINYLQTQLRIKEEENVKLKAEIKLMRIEKKGGADPQEDQEMAELTKKVQQLTYQLKRAEDQIKSKQVDLEKECYYKFRNDIKGRLAFVDKMLDFNKLSNEVNGVAPKKKPINFFQKIGKAIIEDGQLAHEHFASS